MSGSASLEGVEPAQSQVLESADIPELGEPPFDGPRLSRRHSEDSYIRAERCVAIVLHTLLLTIDLLISLSIRPLASIFLSYNDLSLCVH